VRIVIPVHNKIGIVVWYEVEGLLTAMHDSDIKCQKKLNGRNYISCASNQKAYEGFFSQFAPENYL
jgi:hypothetical protein